MERGGVFRAAGGVRYRWTIRLRLTLLYGGLFLGAGALLLAVTYVLVAHALPFVHVKEPSPPDLARPPGTIPAPDVTPPSLDLRERLGRQRAADLRGFLMASGLGLVLMTFMSVGLGWLMAGRVLRPLRTMTSAAREISARDLRRRLAVPGPDDELKDLADTFDRVLDRLEAAFEAQRAFVANASHELRTPLTFERSLLEVALADPDATAADLRAACERVLDGNRHQERLIEALLTLARGQRGIGRSADLDLAEIAGPLLDDVCAEAAAREVRVDAQLRPAPTSGDARLVERLTINLLDNAVRHNVAGGHMIVRTGVGDGRPVLHVANSGPMVPPDRIDAILRPFERLGGPRTGADDGLGLGLSIVAAVVAAHDADLDIRQRAEGGLDIRVTFPQRGFPPAQLRRGTDGTARPRPAWRELAGELPKASAKAGRRAARSRRAR